MVVQSTDNKEPSSLAGLLVGSAKSKNTQANDAFAQLLSTLSEPSIAKTTDFTAIIDPKKSSVASTNKSNSKGLEELLSGTTDESKLFSKELINALSNDQLHSLIHKAKEYLKNAITEKSSEIQADPKSLPKTLMGLVELAQKIGIDLSEITLTTLDKERVSPLKELPLSLLTKPLLELKGPVNDSGKAPAQPLQSLLKGLDPFPDPVVETQKELSKSFISPPHMEALSALLRGNNEADVHQSKEEINPLAEAGKSHQVHKADSLEVKGKEAVQSMRHFAIDLKEAAESYKPPFTRLTMKLNPERLGEVDVTLIQRGNNVHVTIQSANANSIAFLAHNASELKAQLAAQGVTNTTMNFMTGSENQQQNPGQQQQNQNRFRSYQSLAELEHSTEELSALEIIIPHYA